MWVPEVGRLGDPSLQGRPWRLRIRQPGDSGRTATLTGPSPAPRCGRRSSIPPTRTWPATPFRDVSSASTRFESPTKSATNRLYRRLVELPRRPALGDGGVVHDDDAVGDRERLLLIVRHVGHREAQALLELADVLADPAAQLGVEVRQGLVEAEHLRLEDERARATATRCCWPPESSDGSRAVERLRGRPGRSFSRACS